MDIRNIEKKEMQKVLSMIWVSFNRFVAPDFTREGVDTFYRLLHEERILQDMDFYGAFAENAIMGVIAVNQQKSHLCFFFVDEQYQSCNVYRGLFDFLLRQTDQKVITVNASPYGEKFCRELGFQPTDSFRIQDGIRYCPMSYVRP